MNSHRIEKLRAALARLQPQLLDIDDEGHLHAGHAGAQRGGHFRIRLVSAHFAGHSLIERHRMVYEAAGSLMKTDIHALSIRAQTPQEAALAVQDPPH